MIKEAIITLSRKESLSYESAQEVMSEMMLGKASPVEMAGFLTALSMKGASSEEISASAATMREYASPIKANVEVLDIVGTGGDKSNSFNISTTSAIVLAAAGATVGKHGNRASSSKCGSADVLEALGVNIEISPEKAAKMLETIGITFLFAPTYHKALKHVMPVRKELGIPTIFNILGPLANPLKPTMQLLGVYREDLMEPMAKVLMKLGVTRGMVVFGTDGLDEISMSGPTKILEINRGEISKRTVFPTDFGMDLCRKEDLEGGTPEENAKITMSILRGERSHARNAVVINAACAYSLTDRSRDLNSAISRMETVLDEGKALEKLKELVEFSQEEEQ